MSLFSDEYIEKIKNYDFFNTEGPYFDDPKPIVAWGRFKEKIPMVSILLTTYKRPDMLRRSLSSAINQMGFDDYEILVFDNECAPLDEITETQKVIEELNSSKVVYFRNQIPCSFRMNMVSSFARTEWICYMHDDDKMNPYHLSVMTKIVNEHSKIDFLACRNKPHTIEEIKHSGENPKELEGEYICRRVHMEEMVFLNNYTWLGALIKLDKFKEVGGTCSIRLEMGDTIFATKCNYLLNRYYIHFPGYNYLHSGAQLSSDRDAWINCFYTNYFFSCYVLKKIYGKCTEAMEEMVKQKMVDELEKVAKERNYMIDHSDYFRRIGTIYDMNNSDLVERNKKRIVEWEAYLLKLRDVGEQFPVNINIEEEPKIEVGR